MGGFNMSNFNGFRTRMEMDMQQHMLQNFKGASGLPGSKPGEYRIGPFRIGGTAGKAVEGLGQYLKSTEEVSDLRNAVEDIKEIWKNFMDDSGDEEEEKGSDSGKDKKSSKKKKKSDSEENEKSSKKKKKSDSGKNEKSSKKKKHPERETEENGKRSGVQAGGGAESQEGLRAAGIAAPKEKSGGWEEAGMTGISGLVTGDQIHCFLASGNQSANLRQAVVWAEILGEPVSKKRRRKRECMHGNQSNADRR